MFTSVACYSKQAHRSPLGQEPLSLGRSRRQEHWGAGLTSRKPLSDPQWRRALSQAGVNLREDSCLFCWLKIGKGLMSREEWICPTGLSEESVEHYPSATQGFTPHMELEVGLGEGKLSSGKAHVAAWEQNSYLQVTQERNLKLKNIGADRKQRNCAVG